MDGQCPADAGLGAVGLLEAKHNEFEVYFRDQPSRVYTDRFLLANEQTNIIGTIESRTIPPAYIFVLAT